jgi:acylphosphatase
MDEKRVHVYVTGTVQGVSFRYYTLQEATRAGATGWVRNLPDGRVEAVFEGSEAAVERVVAWCRQGPRGARVEQVEILPETPTGEFQGFRIR